MNLLQTEEIDRSAVLAFEEPCELRRSFKVDINLHAEPLRRPREPKKCTGADKCDAFNEL